MKHFHFMSDNPAGAKASMPAATALVNWYKLGSKDNITKPRRSTWPRYLCVWLCVCVCEAFSGVRSLNPARRTPPRGKGQESTGSRCQEMACFGAARFYSSLHIHAGCHDDAVAPPGGNAPWPLDWNCFNVKKRFATRVIT